MFDRFPEKPPRWLILLLIIETIVSVPTGLALAFLTCWGALYMNDPGKTAAMACITVMSQVPMGQWLIIKRWKLMADRLNQLVKISN